MLLSIAMMVKNEEKYLEDCLTALQPILNNVDSELIIVDTGSTDSTMEIARRFTDKLYFHQWNDNFGEMRNITISYAKGKWIFILDADEVLENCNNIIEFFNSGDYKNYKSARLLEKNLTSIKDNEKYNMMEALRLFEKSKDFKYKGLIHEQPAFEYPMGKVNDVIKHYGYISHDKDLMESKFNRNVALLESGLKIEPNNLYYYYQLANSYSMHGDYKKALNNIEKAYKLCKDNHDNNKIKYVMKLYCFIQLKLFNLDKVEDLGKKALALCPEDQLYKIDIYYFIYKAKLILFEAEAAIPYGKHYLRLIDKYEKGLLPSDMSITVYSIDSKDNETEVLVKLLIEQERYEEVIHMFGKEDSNKKYLKFVIWAYLKLEDYEGLRNYYSKLIGEETVEESRFSDIVEGFKLELPVEAAQKIELSFSVGDSTYEKLNYIRVFSKEKIIEKEIEELLDGLELDNLSDYYGDVIYCLMSMQHDVTLYINKISYSKLNRFMMYCTKIHKGFSQIVYNYLLNKNIDICNFHEVKATVILCRYLILLHELDKEKEDELFKNYIELGKTYVSSIYSKFILDEERVIELKNDEDAFFMYLLKGDLYKEKDLAMYIMYLRKALSTYDVMKNGIESLIKEIEEKVDVNNNGNSKNQELENLKIYFRKNIEVLISQGELASAEEFIRQYEEFLEVDSQILSYKSQIETIKQREDEIN